MDQGSTVFGWEGSCTTSGRSGPARQCFTRPGTLTAEEFRQITEHPALGERMLAPLAQESPDVLRIVRSHHERLDGAGFPDGLRGDNIPIEARIVAVADAFDAMTTRRPYRDPKPADAAVCELGGWQAPSSTLRRWRRLSRHTRTLGICRFRPDPAVARAPVTLCASGSPAPRSP